MTRGRIVGMLIAVLAVARHDLWWWDAADRVLGVPIGLAYHVLFCLAVAAVMAVWIRAMPVERAPESRATDRAEGAR